MFVCDGFALAADALIAQYGVLDEGHVGFQRMLDFGQTEFRQKECGENAKQFTEQRTKDPLMETRRDSVPLTVERIFDGWTQHMIQVHLSRLK